MKTSFTIFTSGIKVQETFDLTACLRNLGKTFTITLGSKDPNTDKYSVVTFALNSKSGFKGKRGLLKEEESKIEFFVRGFFAGKNIQLDNFLW